MSTSKFLKSALPLIPTHGFSLSALTTSSHLSPSTLNALFPSPSLSSSSSSSSFSSSLRQKRGGKRSMTRQELILDAQGLFESPEDDERERIGPARALVEAWLEEGLQGMVSNVREKGLRGDRAVKEGLEWRLRYNEPVLDMLPDALGLLGAHELPLPVPSPIPILAHVGKIGHSLALISHPEAQGTEWYNKRMKISLSYGLTELRLLAPSSSLEPSERIERALQTMSDLRFAGSRFESLAVDYPNFIWRSWKGIFQSL